MRVFALSSEDFVDMLMARLTITHSKHCSRWSKMYRAFRRRQNMKWGSVFSNLCTCCKCAFPKGIVRVPITLDPFSLCTPDARARFAHAAVDTVFFMWCWCAQDTQSTSVIPRLLVMCISIIMCIDHVRQTWTYKRARLFEYLNPGAQLHISVSKRSKQNKQKNTG